MAYRIGIDAGSKTVKLIILDEGGTMLFSAYRRHQANVVRTLAATIENARRRLGDVAAHVAITGSSAIGIAETLRLPFVQEVIATAHAVGDIRPDADVAIELGGEDAKIIYLSGDVEQRMNTTCAGGTGGFIDTIAFMLDVDPSDMSDLAFEAHTIHPIASRCAVFAQTDIRPLLNAGASKADIAASAYDAVVRQTIGGLACGRPLKGTIVFLGGPLEHAPYLVARFRERLGLAEDAGVKPPDAHLLTARGTALLSTRENPSTQTLTELLARIASLDEPEDDLGRLGALFESEEDLARFEQRHRNVSFERAPLESARGPLYLGIDAGSTTVKLAVIDDEARLLRSAYEPIKGDMPSTLAHMLVDLRDAIPRPREQSNAPAAWIAHATATGYGEDLVRAGLGVDSGVVETAAHLRAALHLRADTSFLLDIGGQDMKALWVRDGRIVDAVLNEACSSGCGAFVESTAHSLNITPDEFARQALRAKRPVDLGTRCTVFMNSRVRHAQKIGASLEDIAAGVAYSVVHNALFRIIGANKIDTLGDAIVVQGGTFKSNAVLRAFELTIGAEVTRCDQAHLAGAIGAALIARERARDKATTPTRHHNAPVAPDETSDPRNADGRKAQPSNPAPMSTLISREALEAFAPVKQRTRCSGCENRCALDVTFFGGGRAYVSGNRCPRGVDEALRATQEPAVEDPTARFGQRASHHALPGEPPEHRSLRGESDFKPVNLVAREQQLIARYGDVKAPGMLGSLQIGVIGALETYEHTAFWHTLIVGLGFSVLTPDCEDMTACPIRAWESVPSDGVCYPAKIAHPRFYSLREKGADFVLMPKFERGNHCPVSCEYADALSDNVEEPPLISPLLIGYKPTRIAQDERSLGELHRALDHAARAVGARISRVRFDEAIAAALREQQRFEKTLIVETEKALAELARNPSGHAVLLAGRPYHNDVAFMHGIDEELLRQGFTVLCMAGLANHLREARKRQYAGTYPWKPAKRLVRAATFVAENPGIDMICLQSFGCGFDAMSIEETRGVLEEAGKPCTTLKIDDITDTAHIRIRLRTLAEAIESGKRRGASSRCGKPSPCSAREGGGEASTPSSTPKVNPCKILTEPPLDLQDLSIARRDTASDVCFTADAMAARVIRLIRENPGVEHIELPPTCPDCLTEAIPRMVERATGAAPSFSWSASWDEAAKAAAKRCGDKATMSRAGAAVRPDEPKPKVGIVGNPLLCFDPFMNDDLAEMLIELGCEPVLPEPKLICVEDVRYLDQLAGFDDGGIRDIIYLLSFGCLKGHVHGRGALHEIKKLFPLMSITFVDYDPEASALNRKNRIRLAAETARERLAAETTLRR